MRRDGCTLSKGWCGYDEYLWTGKYLYKSFVVDYSGVRVGTTAFCFLSWIIGFGFEETLKLGNPHSNANIHRLCLLSVKFLFVHNWLIVYLLTMWIRMFTFWLFAESQRTDDMMIQQFLQEIWSRFFFTNLCIILKNIWGRNYAISCFVH